MNGQRASIERLKKSCKKLKIDSWEGELIWKGNGLLLFTRSGWTAL